MANGRRPVPGSLGPCAKPDSNLVARCIGRPPCEVDRQHLLVALLPGLVVLRQGMGLLDCLQVDERGLGVFREQCREFSQPVNKRGGILLLLEDERGLVIQREGLVIRSLLMRQPTRFLVTHNRFSKLAAQVKVIGSLLHDAQVCQVSLLAYFLDKPDFRAASPVSTVVPPDGSHQLQCLVLELARTFLVHLLACQVQECQVSL